MKTFEEFWIEAINSNSETPITDAKIQELAAKEYAKQWIDKAAAIGRMYAGLNSANAIEDLKSKIDAQ